MRNGIKIDGVFWAEVLDEKRRIFIPRHKFGNLVVDVGIIYAIQNGIAADMYIFLMNDTPVVDADDTMASHSGWTEFTGYDETARQIWDKTLVDKTMTNAGNEAEFTITNDGSSIGGAGIALSATKDEGASVFYCGAPFTNGNDPANAGYIMRIGYASPFADNGA